MYIEKNLMNLFANQKDIMHKKYNIYQIKSDMHIITEIHND